jgi:hypothetical protein
VIDVVAVAKARIPIGVHLPGDAVDPGNDTPRP